MTEAVKQEDFYTYVLKKQVFTGKGSAGVVRQSKSNPHKGFYNSHCVEDVCGKNASVPQAMNAEEAVMQLSRYAKSAAQPGVGGGLKCMIRTDLALLELIWQYHSISLSQCSLIVLQLKYSDAQKVDRTPLTANKDVLVFLI